MNQDFLKYIRSLSKSDKKTLSQKALKTAEEVGELAKVVLPHDNAYATNHRMPEREKILEESCDILLCALSVAYDLDFTDEEIEAMMLKKADKWAVLQSKEVNLQYPLPYEIHCTIQLTEDDAPYRLDEFRKACAAASVKPIIIDLQKNTGESVMRDVMTSSRHFGNNRSAMEEMDRISGVLANYDFEPVRLKIETVPWHPAAPKYKGEAMPPNCYFEAHVGVRLREEELEWFRACCSDRKLHVSKNAFKKYDNGEMTIMATYRDYDTWTDKFNSDVLSIRGALTRDGFELEKPITEFAVYDTKVSHDASWLLKG